MASLRKANLRRSWENAWLKADFSWKGLSNKTTPPGGRGRNLQIFLRGLSGSHDDDALESSGVLVRCKNDELYHVLFIPEHWRDRYVDDEKTFHDHRSKIFQQYLAHCQNVESQTINGMAFYSDEAHSPISRIRYFNTCYIACNLNPMRNNGSLDVKRTFVDGSVANHERVSANIHLNISHSYITRSLNPYVTEGRQVAISLKHTKISEGIKIVECEVPYFSIGHCSIGSLSLKSIRCVGDCKISNSEIKQGFVFDASDFEGQVSITETDISLHSRLVDCDFEDRVVFRDVQWSTDKISSALTTGSRFKELVTFTSRDTPPIQFFNGGTFESNIGFDSRYHGKWDDAFRQELNSQDQDSNRSEILAGKLEVAARNLRNLAQQRGDGPMEHFWHRAEIIARRKTNSVRGLEKFSSNAYGWLADYGLSIGRPFSWLFGLVLVLGVFYGYLGGSSWVGRFDQNALELGIGYSLHQSFPLGVFDDFDEVWLERLLDTKFSWQSALVRILATAQTIFSAILIYLGVMAVRRKFKIS